MKIGRKPLWLAIALINITMVMSLGVQDKFGVQSEALRRALLPAPMFPADHLHYLPVQLQSGVQSIERISRQQ